MYTHKKECHAWQLPYHHTEYEHNELTSDVLCVNKTIAEATQ